MRKKINLLITILCIIEVICCFTPFCLDREFWKYEQSLTYHGISTLKNHQGVNIFENYAVLGKPLAVLFVCLAIIVAAIYFAKVLDYTTKITNRAWIFVIAHTVAMVIFLVYSGSIAEKEYDSFRFEYSINWMSYIIIALNLIVLIFSILLKMDKVNKLPFKRAIEKEQRETTDDLLAYKELLDSGILSQEEFEVKKKQILDL